MNCRISTYLVMTFRFIYWLDLRAILSNFIPAS